MIQKFLAKYFFEVIPSIVATVVGAYIVTHYINSKPATEKPPAEISAPVKAATTPAPAKNTDAKAEARKADAAKDSIKAEPKSEPARPAVKAASRSSDKAEEKAEDAGTRHRQPAREAAKDEGREKAAARAPVEATRETDNRDANELARDALARLRGGTDQPKSEQAKAESSKAEQPKPEQAKSVQVKTGEPKPDAVVRAPETPSVQEAGRPQHERPAVRVIYSPANNPAAAQPQIPTARQEAAVPPMGPPVTITPSPQLPTYASDQGTRLDDPSRPTPPADIPLGARERGHTSVAEDVVSAAKSVFEAVVPR